MENWRFNYMNKDITVIIRGQITGELLENYYKQLWLSLQGQCGEEVLQELYMELCKES